MSLASLMGDNYDRSVTCREALHPYEHRPCDSGECGCHCHRPKVDRDPAPRRRISHDPVKMLDHSEVTVGCYVSRSTSWEVDAEGRGGIVIDIDTIDDPETGERVRLYSTAKEWRGGIRWDRINQADVEVIDVPNLSMTRSLWRAMCRAAGKCKGTAHPEELRLIETARLLTRSES